MIDLRIRNGVVVGLDGAQRSDILISDGKILDLVSPGSPATALEEIDATGLTLIPGLVDSHAHFREPGAVAKEGFETGTAAAALGGVTTVIILPTDIPLTTDATTVRDKVALGFGRAHIDYALTGIIGRVERDAREMAALGIVGLEAFLIGADPNYRLDATTDLRRAATWSQELGVTLSVTPGNDDMVAANIARLKAEGRRDFRAHAEARPAAVEAQSVATACRLALDWNLDIHIRQVSAADSVETIRSAHAKGARITAETLPHSLLLDPTLLEELGPFAIMAPPLRGEADRAALWAGIADGTIEMVATDHAPHLPADKDIGSRDVWKTPLGVPGLQTLFPAMYSQVAAGRLNLGHFVRLCSEAPARRFGLFPAKGCLKPGSDADLVAFDPAKPQTIGNEDQASKAASTPFAGWSCPASIAFTMLAGTVIARDGHICDGRPKGRYVERRY